MKLFGQFQYDQKFGYLAENAENLGDNINMDIIGTFPSQRENELVMLASDNKFDLNV